MVRTGLKRSFIRLSKLPLILAAFYAPGGHATEALEYIWSNSQGILSASVCEVSKKEDTRFKVVQYFGDDDPGYENLRNRDKEVFSRVVNRSLVKFLNGSDIGNFKHIEVTAVHEEPGLDIPGHVAQRNYNGYIYNKSLKPITDYVFQIIGTPEASEAGEVTSIPQTNYGVVGTFLQPVLSVDSQYVIFKCDGKDYIVFDMHVGQQETPVGRIGINWDQTRILRHLRTYTLELAEVAIEEQKQEVGDVTDRPSSLQWWHQYLGGFGTQQFVDAANLERPEEGEGYEEDELREAQEAERAHLEAQAQQIAEEELSEDNLAIEETEEPVVQTEAPIIMGELEFRVCVDQGPLAVRSLTESGEIDTNSELLKVRRYALAKPVQSWDEAEKKATIRGVEYTYIQVQFPEVEGENIGWVAQNLVVPSSHCAGYQDSLGDKQTIACTSSGQLNVYDGNFETLNFRADQFEEIAVRTDMNVRPQVRTVNGRRYEYTPVVFPNRNGALGWVAKSFVKTKENCEAYKNKSSTSSDSGPLFPVIGRPTMSYVRGGYAVGKKYFGAPRGGGRKHAACDLFRPAYERVESVSNGTLLRGPYEFFSGTFAIEIKSTTGKILRYGETSSKRPNSTVKRGDFISTIGKNYAGTAMLHFEMYTGAKTGSLSGGSKPYNRRSDLMDPTSGLREWEKARFGKSY